MVIPTDNQPAPGVSDEKGTGLYGGHVAPAFLHRKIQGRREKTTLFTHNWPKAGMGFIKATLLLSILIILY